MSTERMNITDGPCELDFFVLGLARRQPVTFEVEETKIKLILNGISAEDGSGKSWLFEGLIVGDSPIPGLSGRVNGWFSYTRHRVGWIKSCEPM